MAFRTLPAICSAAPYQPYLRLSVYPPAQGYCSIILSERAVQIGDPNCASKGYLCSLFSYLQAVDPEFAQTVCCCITDCPKPKTTLISIATSPERSISSASSEIGGTASTSSVRSETFSLTTDIPTSSISPTISWSTSSPGRSLSTSSSSTEPPPSSNLPSPSVTSHPPPSSTTLNSRTPSTTSRPRSSFTTAVPTSSIPISTSIVPSTPAYTACATCSYPTPTAECMAINGYQQYHSGECHVENTHNPGNIDPLYPPIYSIYPGVLNACDAATDCALRSEGFDANVYTSFDLHYLCSNASWVCVQYHGANFRASYFDVQDFDAVVSYGYYSVGNHD